MQCPKCKGRILRIYGVFDGTQEIHFTEDGDFDVIDSEPTDFSWSDHSSVDCLDCGHSDIVTEFIVEVRE